MIALNLTYFDYPVYSPNEHYEKKRTVGQNFIIKKLI